MALLWIIGSCRAGYANEPIVRLDLQKFGYQLTSSAPIGDYTELSFLSEDLLVVSVNQRAFFGSSARLNMDIPDSTILVVDLTTGRIITSGRMPVEKRDGSVQAVWGGRLAVFNEKGLQLCTADLRCGTPIAGPGPMFVSPRGRRIVFGGDGLSPRRVLDAESFKQVTVFEDPSPFAYGGVIPGDRALLVSRGASLFAIQQPGKEDKLIEFDRGGDFNESRFLSDVAIIYLDYGSKEAVVAGLDGTRLHRHKLKKAYRTSFLSTASGKRFGIYEHGYSFLNSLVNVLDIDDTRPQDFQRVRLIDVSSGNEVAMFEWNPRADPMKHLIEPQLSPSGHRLAKVEAGVLEVLPIN